MTENPLRAALEDALFSLDAITDKVDGTGFNISDEFSRCLDSIDLIRAALATPSDAPEQTAKPRHYVNTIAAHNSEMCCRLGITMGHLRDDGSRELECILERLDRAQKQIAQQTVSEQTTDRGWLEAAIAWEVCASIHEKYAKGKDALYKTRHGDFVKHASDCRSAAHFTRPVAQQAAPEQATIPMKEIQSILGEVMSLAVANGANSISMPDEYVAVAHFLAYPQEYAAPPQQRDESKSAANARRYEWLRSRFTGWDMDWMASDDSPGKAVICFTFDPNGVALDRDISKYIDAAIAVTHSKGETT